MSNKIHDIIITGDFHPSPYQVLRDMEDAVRGKECSTGIIGDEIRQIFGRPDVEIAGTDLEDFLGAFSMAFRDAEK